MLAFQLPIRVPLFCESGRCISLVIVKLIEVVVGICIRLVRFLGFGYRDQGKRCAKVRGGSGYGLRLFHEDRTRSVNLGCGFFN